MRDYREFYGNGMIRFLVCVLLVSGTMAGYTYQGMFTWLSVASGIGIFGVFEYITHRYLLHQYPRIAPKMHAGHEAHHKDPNNAEFLFGPARYDMIGYPLYFLALLALSRNLPYACAAVFGASLLQFYYQWMHYVSHRPVKLWTPWGKWMKKKHLLHHHQDEHAWYGVSNPVLDYVMGTSQPKPKASFEEKTGRARSPTHHS